ncbi:efflux RND transporter periplasmic adaptor subunit [Pseudoduganella sp. GCM10020061]|uniref:efflux RND transporter periplasmic adaptor subunit n=1 Tax=Pseudoduganella sp. GCM10020061 TaxID=3317345 RepID=UPI00363B8F8F
MKNQKIVLAMVAAGVLAAGGYGMYRIGMKQGMQMQSAPAGQQASGKPAERKVLYWHDPMAPGQKFDKPGKSPFMDMPLVPVYADEAAGGSAVTIDPRVRQNLGIRTEEVSAGPMVPTLEAVGNVAYNERAVALVQARSNGFVERLFVRAPLDPVRKGQALAEVYMPEWVAAQEEYLAVSRMQGNGAEGLLDAARQRMRLVGMTEDQVAMVASSGKVQPRLTVRAPVGGVVASLEAREGMTVSMGTPLFRINGLDTVWVNAEVPEALAAQVRPGSTVAVRAPALAGSLQGRVGALLPEVNAGTRTLLARIELPNPGHRLVPGMFANVSFAPAARAGVLTVPTEAVIVTGTRSVVMLAREDGGFTPVDVDTGAEQGGRTEILRGLEAGQRVVVSGQFLIDSEASLRGTATRMGAAPAHGKNAPAAGTHRGEGKVELVEKDHVTLSHGPIASLKWPAMTMGFKIAPARLPKQLAVGDTVSFDLHRTSEGDYEIVRIQPAQGGAHAHGAAKEAK